MAQEQSHHYQSTHEQWTPPLHFHTSGGRCRLLLGNYTYGNGNTLQEAADDLIARLLTIAQHFHHGSGFTFSSELPPTDFHWFEFLYEIDEMARRGQDIRPRVFAPGVNSTT
jgi:hypothetical protein